MRWVFLNLLRIDPIPASLAHLAPNSQYTEWITNVRVKKHGLGQTFRVIVFLGTFDQDPTTWDTEFNVVGRVTVLGRSPKTRCEKCQDDMANDLIVTGTVSLTSALIQDCVGGELHSLEQADVVPHLKRNLQWRVTLFDGIEHPVDQVPGLQVSVCSTKVTIGGDGLPVYSHEYTTHEDITHGRPGGLAA